jgi:Alpha-glutamyl/putrescinyl thymine pyrophosphorylase clade 3
MRPKDCERADSIERALRHFDKARRRLPGIDDPRRMSVLVEQIIESIHRVDYVTAILGRDISGKRADPNSEIFDPLRAAILHKNRGNRDEAFWLVFLFIHFGKSSRCGWKLISAVYGGLGEGQRWDWNAVSTNPEKFRTWLRENEKRLKELHCGFGNHRKRESLSADSKQGTGVAVQSYVEWVSPPRTHDDKIVEALDQCAGNPQKAFDFLYNSMSAVRRFGRLAKFDYLTMTAKLGLASISPGIPYFEGSSGPLEGARLLFGGNDDAAALDTSVADLGSELSLGMQVMEDSLCNWQKNPDCFKSFRG